MFLTWFRHVSYMVITLSTQGHYNKTFVISYMVVTWSIYGSYMFLWWLIYGSNMFFTWSKHGPYQVITTKPLRLVTWFLHDPQMVLTRFIHSSCMTHKLFHNGSCMALWFSKYPRIVRDFCMAALCLLLAYGCQEEYKGTESAFSKAQCHINISSVIFTCFSVFFNL